MIDIAHFSGPARRVLFSRRRGCYYHPHPGARTLDVFWVRPASVLPCIYSKPHGGREVTWRRGGGGGELAQV